MSLAIRYDGELPFTQEAQLRIAERDQRRIDAKLKRLNTATIRRARDAKAGEVIVGSSDGALKVDPRKKPGSAARVLASKLIGGIDSDGAEGHPSPQQDALEPEGGVYQDVFLDTEGPFDQAINKQYGLPSAELTVTIGEPLELLRAQESFRRASHIAFYHAAATMTD
jgi:hypothetical protein